MKAETRFKTLFSKYLKGNCSPAEIEEFFELWKQFEGTSLFEADFIENEASKLPSAEFPVAKSEQVFKRITLKKKPVRKQFNVLKIAAVFIGLIIGTGLIWFFNQTTSLNNTNSNGGFAVIKREGLKDIILDNTEMPILSEQGDTIGIRKGGKIQYTKEVESLSYNTLYVPKGKKMELSLADGSHIHLNSGSSIRYPLNFKSADKRVVTLKGEAYFEVAKDSLKPFIVSASGVNVQVLGTSFNFNAYQENPATEVVLVEGLVAMYKTTDVFKADETQLLRPGFKGSYTEGKEITKVAVDTDTYTSWRYGHLIYRNKTLAQIFISLERNFNIEIKNKNTKLAQEVINANFGSESVENIMEYLHEIYDFEYTFKDNLLIIKE